MAEVIVIGGGLSGLAAAWELARLQIDCTLIEVRPRLGGSIMTERQAGFTFDGGGFIHEQYAEWPFLDDLGLADALEPIGRYRDGRLVIFRDGTQMLVDALAARTRATLMLRMAVSSIGRLPDGRFGVCLENGLLLETRGIVVAVPARFAAHMLYALAPEAALLLEDYRYDPTARVSLGFRAREVGDRLPTETGGLFRFIERYVMPSRVPPDHALIRVGVRLGYAADVSTPEAALSRAQALFAAQPTAAWVHFWPEGDPLTRHTPEHVQTMAAIDGLLPPGVALVGSDYRALRLDQQIAQGRAAAQQVAASL